MIVDHVMFRLGQLGVWLMEADSRWYWSQWRKGNHSKKKFRNWGSLTERYQGEPVDLQ